MMVTSQLCPTPSLAPFSNLRPLPSDSHIMSHDVLRVQTTAQGESLKPVPLLSPSSLLLGRLEETGSSQLYNETSHQLGQLL